MVTLDTVMVANGKQICQRELNLVMLQYKLPVFDYFTVQKVCACLQGHIKLQIIAFKYNFL